MITLIQILRALNSDDRESLLNYFSMPDEGFDNISLVDALPQWKL